MRRAELEALLEQVPPPPTARPEREQVRTPPGVAADLLWRMHEEEAVAGRRVLDLGCGTGILAWGATALGAAEVLGVDVDGEAVAAARGLALAAPPPRFVVADLTDWHPEPAWDAVVMNPPFGAQRADRHADRVFYRCAAEAVAGAHGSAWFLAQPRTQPFLRAQAADVGASLTRVAAWRYPLQAFYPHHTEDVRLLDVAAYRLAWA